MKKPRLRVAVSNDSYNVPNFDGKVKCKGVYPHLQYLPYLHGLNLYYTGLIYS